jgi:hypothetical protein
MSPPAASSLAALAGLAVVATAPVLLWPRPDQVTSHNCDLVEEVHARSTR